METMERAGYRMTKDSDLGGDMVNPDICVTYFLNRCSLCIIEGDNKT